MAYRGKILKGQVQFEEPLPLPDGTEVIVEAVDEKSPTLFERFADLVGKADDLPEDMARNHDHYIHGTDKKW